jgi:tetratricopeptide (TPR) repeat protein
VTTLLDTVRFKTAATAAVAVIALGLCALIAHRAIAYQRGVWGAGIYAAGDPARAYPYLVRAAQAGLLGRLNAGPLLDLGEVGTWAMDDVGFLKHHPEMSTVASARTAFVAYAAALQRRPTSSTALAGLADLFRRMGTLKVLKTAGAVPDVGSLESKPGEPTREDRLVEAAYRRAIDMEPANYFWYAYLADFFVERGRRGEALPLYGRAIELMPDLGWHYYLGASGPLPRDLFDIADAALERALETNVVYRPEKIESNLGYLHERQRDFDNALAHYRRAIELAPDPSQYLYQAAVVLGFTGRQDEAMEYFKRSLARGTLGPHLEGAALSRLGRLMHEKGDGRAAVEYLTRARSLEPENYALRLDLGRALQAIGGEEKAETEYRNAISLDPARPEAYRLLIEVYRGRRDYARAIPLARRLVELYPDDGAIRELLDGLYREMGAEPAPPRHGAEDP